SLAILDYLEFKYPTPALLPKDIEALTVVRMIEMTTLHELIPAMLTLIRVTDNQDAVEQANQQIVSILKFLSKRLNDSVYIGGDCITLAEIVAGSLILWLPALGINLSSYPKVESWSNQLMQRPTWQATQPDPEIIQDWLKRIKKLPKIRQRHWRGKRK
ncbi:MAG: glutathione S-transferase family protein, partial [Cyanobacteria bacterium P01_A01_bin.83]